MLFWCETIESQSKIIAFDFSVQQMKTIMIRPNKIFPFSAVLSEGLILIIICNIYLLLFVKYCLIFYL